jgi:putative ABC transport system permease protein
MIQDFRLAWRSMANRPGFFALCILTLALGVGSVAAIYSVVNGVLLKPLPYPEADRIVRINRTQGQFGGPVSGPVLEDWRAATDGVFGAMGAFTSSTVNLTGDGDAERLGAYQVTPGFWDVMALQAEVGRYFTAAEDAADERVAVLSHELWTSRFGADPGVVGRDILLNGEAHRVVGVTPAAFRYPGSAQVYVPTYLAARTQNRGSNFLFIVARLRPGASLEQAGAILAVENTRLAAAHPDNHGGLGARLTPLPELLNSSVRQPLLILLGASALVLLIACANLANLLLARASRREREFAIRAAMGAGQARLVRMLLAEGFVIALAGGVAGVAIAAVAVPGLLTLAPSVIPSHGRPVVDLWAVCVSLVVATATVLLFALWPALRAAAVPEAAALKDEARGSSGGRDKARTRAALVIAEVALSLTLLVGAGLLIESLRQLDRLETGVDPERVLTAAFTLQGVSPLPDEEFPSAYRRHTESMAPALDAILARVAAISGVEHVGLSDALPLSGMDNVSSHVTVVGREVPEGQRAPGANWRFVSPGFLEALGMRTVAGRNLDRTDQRVGVDPVNVLVNETFARRYLGGADPIGRQLVFMIDQQQPKTVVGVVNDTRLQGIDRDVVAEIYMPHVNSVNRQFYLALKVRGDPMSFAGPLRQAVREIDSNIPLFDLRTMEQVIGEPIQLRRFNMTLMSVFGGIALLLAALGLYGVLAYSVAQRRQEIGIRVSLGASPGGIVAMVLRQGGRLIAAGVVVGLAGAYAVTRIIASQLYGVQPGNLAVLGAVVGMMVVVGLLATFLPARHAARVQPMEALRHE